MTETAGSGKSAFPPFSVGPVFQETFRIFFTRFPLFFLFSAYIWIPDIILEYITGPSSGSSVGVLFMATAFANVAAIQAYNLIHDGEAVPAWKLPNLKGRQLFAAMVVYVLISLMITLGLVLLIFPGLFAIAIYALALPACVTERIGVSESFKRASELSLGYRRKILAAVLLVWVTTVSLALALPLGLVFGASEGSAFLTEPTATLVGGVVSIIAAVANIFSGLFTAVLYRHVLTAKEGGRQEEIAAVFD